MTEKLVPISEAGLPEAIVGSVLNYVVARNLSDDFAVNTETKKVHVNPAILEGTGEAQQGPKGDTGAPGEDGVDGADGKSAYQIWLDNGNTGTEQDFLKSLRGEGLDVASLEEKQFTDDSTIVAVGADGVVYKAKYKAPLFKDVGVTLELTGSTLDGDTTESTVKVVVTNTMAEEAQGVVVTIGAGGDIDVAAERTLNVAANSNESFTFKVRHTGPTFTTATVALAGDTVSSNNTASIALPRKAKVAAGESEGTYTEECPLVEATYNGQRLYGSKQMPSSAFPSEDDLTDYNIITDASTLNGITINLKGISSLLVYTNDKVLSRNNAAGVVKQLTSTDSADTYEAHTITLRGQANNDFSDAYFANTTAYTFDNVSGDLTFTGEAKRAVIIGRPGGADCKYQVWAVSASKATVTNTKKRAERTVSTDANSKYVNWVSLKTISKVNNNSAYHAYDDINVLVNPVGSSNDKNVYLLGTQDATSYKPVGAVIMAGVRYWDSQEYYNYLIDSDIESTEKLRIEIPAGEATTFTINGVALPTTRGAINIDSRTEDGLDGVTRTTTVTVSSTATATDSVYNDLVDIIIK